MLGQGLQQVLWFGGQSKPTLQAEAPLDLRDIAQRAMRPSTIIFEGGTGGGLSGQGEQPSLQQS